MLIYVKKQLALKLELRLDYYKTRTILLTIKCVTFFSGYFFFFFI